RLATCLGLGLEVCCLLRAPGLVVPLGQDGRDGRGPVLVVDDEVPVVIVQLPLLAVPIRGEEGQWRRRHWPGHEAIVAHFSRRRRQVCRGRSGWSAQQRSASRRLARQLGQVESCSTWMYMP